MAVVTRAFSAGGLCVWLSALVYGLWAAPFGHVLDAGELSAAAVQLGIGHPPGQPLSMLVMRALGYLPLGPLSFRFSLASGLAAAAAVGLLFRAARRALARIAQLPGSQLDGLALAAALAFAAAPGVVMQAVRPEVYALQGLVTAGVLERLSALSTRGGLRALLGACVWFGLGCSNHHLLALCLVPSLLIAGFPVLRRSDVRASVALLGCAGLGLLGFLYLPLRAAAAPALNLGDPSTWRRFVWVVSAEAFQQNAGGSALEPLDQRASELWVALLSNGPWLCFLALGGAYLLLRRRVTWPVAMPWLALLLVTACARLSFGYIAGNPDAQGYLLGAQASLSFLALCLVAIVLGSLRSAGRGRLAGATVVLVGGALVLAQASLGARASLARAFAPLEIDVARRMALPSRAVVVAWTPQTVFLHWGGEALDLARPDVSIIPVPLLRYPGLLEQLSRSLPEADGLLQGLRERRVVLSAWDRVAAHRPLFSELDARVPDALFARLSPDGGYARYTRASADPPAPASDPFARLAADLAVADVDGPTREVLLWQYYQDALQLARRGRKAESNRRIDMARDLGPLPPELGRLREALSASGAAPVDVSVARVAEDRVGRFVAVP